MNEVTLHVAKHYITFISLIFDLKWSKKKVDRNQIQLGSYPSIISESQKSGGFLQAYRILVD